MAKKCPLCGGKLKNNYCDSCGYAVPDDEELSALYNLDPSDYPQPQEQPAVREITPDVQAEEIYPNRPEAPRFKVRDDQGKTVANGQNAGQHQQHRQYHQYRQYQQQQTGNPYQNSGGQNSSPYANTGNTSGNSHWNEWFSKELILKFIKKLWWYLLVVFCAPLPAGAILTIILISNKVIKKKYIPIAIAALVLSLFLPPF